MTLLELLIVLVVLLWATGSYFAVGSLVNLLLVIVVVLILLRIARGERL